MNSSERFWNWLAKRYAKRPVADEAVYQRKLEITQGYLRPYMQVLEIGCGTGSTALVHAPHVKHVLATDFSTKMIEIARGKAEAADIANVRFERTSIDALDVPDQSQDVVLALSFLHLVEDRDAVIAKVFRMLKPGGVFVSSTVCLGDKPSFFNRVAPIGHWLGLLPLLKVFAAADVVRSVEAAGFRIDHHWCPDKSMSVFIVGIKDLDPEMGSGAT